MTQKDKDLLLKDLCGRLPYGVIIEGLEHPEIMTIRHLAIISVMTTEPYKPYLRPMDSMTEEEMEELKTLCSIYIPTDSPTIGFEEYGILVFTHHLTNNTYSFKLNVDVIDWLIANHFDYRGLIDMGLAIEVTNENNPYEE